MLTKQEIYNRVIDHFLTMEHGAINPDNNACVYRMKDKSKGCFVGALMDDNMYHPDFEGQGVALILNEGLASKLGDTLCELGTDEAGEVATKFMEYVGYDNGDFLDHLQTIHDYCALDGDHPYWRSRVSKELIKIVEDNNGLAPYKKEELQAVRQS